MIEDEYLFISDCHVDASNPEIARNLIEFLQGRARKARYLYILGDLFEVWLGDDDPATQHQPLLSALAELGRNTQLFFLAGNRDFLVGQTFAEQFGITIIKEPHCLRLDHNPVLLMHGDSLCTDDHDYQQFRQLVRSSHWQSEFLAKSLIERQQIAAKLRSDSTAAMAEKVTEIMDVNEAAVANCFDQFSSATIIHGHTHRPAVHQYGNDNTRIVLGDWQPAASYLSWSASTGFNLVDERVN